MDSPSCTPSCTPSCNSVVSSAALPVAIESLPLYSADEAFRGCYKAVVVAPHPDDETLGCGGAIALLRQRNIPVHVLIMSDGTQSHPRSKQYPADRLRALRESEAIAALRLLHGLPSEVTFFRWPDTAVPHPGDQHFARAVAQCDRALQYHAPNLIFLPWQHDQHCDHQASYQIVHHCLNSWPMPPRQLAYAVWGSRTAGLPALPTGETGWRLDISTVKALKYQAAMAHKSQTTCLIQDDLSGFRLTPTMLNNLIQPWETYLEILGQS
ncbi:MAG: Uncharacterized protein HLUCCA11_17145 [Phormidesmis priestleyi Ana]|uniref:LmbE-like protein n=1 Tax=Phormidesmis priestleyi Ana TaxID=1666911 RepID=A0A0P7ZUB5_9CYAN|nr:MAG: Uncharacterized protein HLUCCA11_17145 [Phormidesmis priestleyi Ana]